MGFLVLVSFLGAPWNALAQVTGPADASRIEQRLKDIAPPPLITPPPSPSREAKPQNAPPGSENIHFVLHGVIFERMTQFTDAQVRDDYAEYLDRDITLDTLWKIAARLTKRYQKAGFFLSRAYVPQQEIGDGPVRIVVVEGYISEVNFDEKAKNNPLVVEWVNTILGKKPLHLKQLESVLLRLSDLAGQNYRAVLELPEDKDAPEGAVRLSVVSTEGNIEGRIGIDNYGSLFLGPVQLNEQISGSIIPNQRTTLTLLQASQLSEMKYGSLMQEIPLSYGWGMDLSGGIIGSRPGDSLARQDISTVSKNFGLGLTYRVIRQREDNLNLRFSYEGRDTKSKILGAELTREFVRAVRVSGNYQGIDSLNGYNLANLTFSQGIAAMGASDAGDLNLSRAEAEPDFRKIEMALTRLQPLSEDFVFLGSVSGQYASAPLYASEEFGYGGQSFGRAYDSSEITGDHGLAGSVELRYSSLPDWQDVKLTPYGFYDIGKVWNEDAGQEKTASGSSAGLGLRLNTDNGVSANIGLAFPLTRQIATPLHGNGSNPRLLLQLGYDY
jgi:hemolysin activation/secretion protein